MTGSSGSSRQTVEPELDGEGDRFKSSNRSAVVTAVFAGVAVSRWGVSDEIFLSQGFSAGTIRNLGVASKSGSIFLSVRFSVGS